MEETRLRINEYMGRLPHLREKIVAVALLLAMSVSMVITVSFAWLALSTNPELSGVNTSIVANGNLEIALASGSVDAPTMVAPSAVGDSNLPTLQRNITWGNLINLSDPAYGLDLLVLRPSLLNKSNLLTKPLHGPVYDVSGRVIDMDTNFGYATLRNGVLESTNELGVRAITSMKYGEAGAVSEYNSRLNAVESANSRNQTTYQSLADNKSYMDALASMMTGYMVEHQLKENSSAGSMISNATLKGSDLTQFALMYRDMIRCYTEQANVFAALMNLASEVNAYDINTQKAGDYPTITGAELLALPYSVSDKTAYHTLVEMGFASSATKGFVQQIDQFLADYKILLADVVRIEALRDDVNAQSGKSITWPKGSAERPIDDIISNFVNVKNCTITADGKTYKISAVGASAALELKAFLCDTKITNGILFNYDNFTGGRIKNPADSPLKLTVKVSLLGDQTIQSNVSTSASDNYFENERLAVATAIKNKIGQPILVANDSYGFAVDFWVRTNAANSYLTLQGNVLTESETVDAKGKDLNGEEVQLYTVTVKLETEEGGGAGGILGELATASYDIYMSKKLQPVLNSNGEPETDAEGNVKLEEVDCWRYADNHTEVPAEYTTQYNFSTNLPPKKVNTIEHVIGFEGDNRVWSGDEMLSVNSTTQGSGSCYVFYSENPVDQARIKVLLKSMKVAFVDAQGNLLANAYMDTDHSYETTGKVTVPLVLDNESPVAGTDEDGNVKYGITALERNVPTLITAVFYLDGEEITNGDVLAAADIRGQLNIQFGSSTLLSATKNEELYNAELFATAEIDGKNQFEYGIDTDMTAKVKVHVTGTQPGTMTAYFIRKINSTQGSPEASFTLTDENKDGIWEGSYTFAYPGEYILRNVRIDGTERELYSSDGTFPVVIVEGFAIKNVSYSEPNGTVIMSDSNTHSVDVGLQFVTEDPAKMPRTVIGQFLRADGAVATVRFEYNATTTLWSGTATFVSSGEYTMSYVILDGEYTELASEQHCTLDLTLGMRVEVTTLAPTKLVYGDPGNPASLQMQVKIFDNNGDPVTGLGRAELNYTAGGSNQLHTGLTWNSAEDAYEGEFRVESGIWKFANVQITMGSGDGKINTITAVTSSTPVFTIIPPTPPSYVATDKTQTSVFGDNAVVAVTLHDAASAKVYAKLVRSDGTVAYVTTTGSADATGYVYSFPITNSGLWTLESVSVFDVFDADGNLHALPIVEAGKTFGKAEYETGLVFDASNGFETHTIAVLKESDLTVEVQYPGAQFTSSNEALNTAYYGKNYETGAVSGLFMQSYTMAAGAIEIRFADKSNSGVLNSGYFDIGNVQLDYKYGSGKTDTAYGGYTSDADISVGLSFATLNFTKGSGNVFAQSDALTFQYAAKYVPNEIRFTIGSEDRTINCSGKTHGEYDIEVWSIAPTVAITGAKFSNGDTIAAAGTTHKAYTSKYEDKTSKWSATEATVYMRATEHDGGCSSDTYTYEPVKIFMTLQNYGFAEKIDLAFSGSTSLTQALYTSPDSLSANLSGGTNSFTWTSSGEIWRWIGYCTVGSSDQNERTAAGTITATQLTLTYGGKTFTVSLATPITLSNPN